MTLSRELFLAILSMDSYNRGYGVGVRKLAESGSLGGATLLAATSEQQRDWQTAGFYAIAYDMTGVSGFAAGERVIAFRGTNFVLEPSFFDSPAWDDIREGWTVSLGANGFNGNAGEQARFAIQFYRAVVDSLGGSDPRSYLISSTGHSLGGGLAGLISGLYDQQATVFDHMPFAGALDRLHNTALISPPVRTEIYGDSLPWSTNIAGINARSTQGEVLDFVRGALSESIVSNELQSGYFEGSNVQLHSMALLTNLIWAETNADSNWIYGSNTLWKAFFSEDLTRGYSNLLTKNIGPGGDALSVLQSAIAYSALDEGERPFGDVAIRAMFDDAADLGTALRYNFMPGWGGSLVNDAVSRVLVEYAGLMALRDVEAFGALANPANAAALGGVLSLDVPEGQAEGQAFPEALRISFGADRWAIGGGVVGGMHQSVQRDYLVSSLLLAAGSDSELSRLERWYSRESGGADLTNTIDEAIFAFGSNPQIEPSDADGIALMVTGDGGTVAQAGTGQDFQISGSGADELRVGWDCLGGLRQCIEACAAANDSRQYEWRQAA